jgi:chromosome segregation protein
LDSGAHFRKCDFQVHTPRDINWIGFRPVSDSDRDVYANTFVQTCREKGIGAVALTDHHDMEFVPYIRKAALAEQDASGNLLGEQDRLTVFPGMELTLQQPCQAIIIFDANFPEDLFAVAYNCLGLVPTARTADQTAETVQLPYDLQDLHRRLDEHPSLKGKYIVIPNVTERGHQTLMRTGFHGHYTAMPCVGGYMDGPFECSDGNRNILNGKVQAWGYKPLAVFATSDCRQADLQTLGDHVTWVKWAEPTAEALRQACLARESRLSHRVPGLPHSIITQISVSNSKFLGNFALEFNQQYNAIIGGRGTGKSTILEYLRWALCDEPQVPDDPEAADFQVKRQKLVEKTLVDTDGSVEVRYSKNGVPHILRRSAKDRKATLKIADGEFEPATEDQIRSILPVQAYSQKQLSSVGVRVEQLRRFIEAPVKDELDDIAREQLAVEGELREQFARYVRKTRRVAERERLTKEATSLQAQIESLRKKLTGASLADKAILDLKPNADIETRFAGRLTEDRLSLINSIELCDKALAALPRPLPENLGAAPNKDLAITVHGLVSEAAAKMRAELERVRTEAAGSLGEAEPIASLLREWDQKRADYEKSYEEAKLRSTAHESVLKQLADLEQRGVTQTQQIEGIGKEIEELGNPDIAFPKLLNEWRQLLVKCSELLSTQCDQLTNLSSGRIRASLQKNADLSAPRSTFARTMRGTSIRTQKIEDLFASIEGSADPLGGWSAICDELLQLALVEGPLEEGSALPETLRLKASLNEADLVRVANKLGPDEWIDLALCAAQNRPVFGYRTREDEYIAFEEASAGQQATALLWALLNQEGVPLIIDQPEDDLDSQVIIEIVNQVWKAKNGRQLIFSSHNANLVVNGDAELVACCDYMVAAEQSKGRIKLEGAIDVRAIREEIAKVMEGGKEAFRLRSEKYGF